MSKKIISLHKQFLHSFRDSIDVENDIWDCSLQSLIFTLC